MNISAIFSPSILLFVFPACSCSSVNYRNQSNLHDGSVEESCYKFVEDYLEKTRNWRSDDYKITPERSEFGGKGYSIIYLHDRDSGASSNGGESFHLELDKSCSKKIAELGYQ